MHFQNSTCIIRNKMSITYSLTWPPVYAYTKINGHRPRGKNSLDIRVGGRGVATATETSTTKKNLWSNMVYSVMYLSMPPSPWVYVYIASQAEIFPSCLRRPLVGWSWINVVNQGIKIIGFMRKTS